MAAYFYKMKVEGGKRTFLDLCDHLSEARMISYALSTLVNRSTMDFYINSENRTRMAAACGISELTVNRNLTKLVGKDLLLRVSRGVYRFNPEYIDYGQHEQGKGRLSELLNSNK